MDTVLGIVCGMGVLCGGAVDALAQDRSPEPPLRGPRVAAPQPGERPGQFGQRPGRDRAGREQGGQMGAMGRVLRVLGSDLADASVRLTEQQITQLRALGKEYRQRQGLYFDTRRGAIAGVLDRLDRAEIAQKVRDGTVSPDQLVEVVERLPREIVGGRDRPGGLVLGRPGDRPDAMTDDRPDRPARAQQRDQKRDPGQARDRARRRPAQGDAGADRRGAMRERLTEQQRLALRELMEVRRGGPNAENLQKQMQSILTEQQQQFVKKEMERLGRDRPGGTRRDGAGVGVDRRPVDAMDERPSKPMRAAISPRLAEVLESLSLEEQEALAEMIQRRMGLERDRQRGSARPPPSMDEIEVPKPQQEGPG